MWVDAGCKTPTVVHTDTIRALPLHWCPEALSVTQTVQHAIAHRAASLGRLRILRPTPHECWQSALLKPLPLVSRAAATHAAHCPTPMACPLAQAAPPGMAPRQRWLPVGHGPRNVVSLAACMCCKKCRYTGIILASLVHCIGIAQRASTPSAAQLRATAQGL